MGIGMRVEPSVGYAVYIRDKKQLHFGKEAMKKWWAGREGEGRVVTLYVCVCVGSACQRAIPCTSPTWPNYHW